MSDNSKGAPRSRIVGLSPGPPKAECPGCHMVREHEAGCPYEHLDIADLARSVRVSTNLTLRARAALALATKLTGDSVSVTVNRALQVYAFVAQTTADGGSVYVRKTADSEELQRLIITSERG